jgi:hypothetical protein
VYNVISAEERNVPAVGLINDGFVEDARSAASGRTMPGARNIPLIVPCEATDITEIETGVDKALDTIISALTRPLTAEEKSPKPKEVEKTSRIIFRGNLSEVNRFFYRRGWTDGLPIMPPTEETVAEMLTGTDLAPDYLLGKLIPRQGKVTVEKIAVNAVMAGALPTYMPVLIAGTRLLLESEMGFQGFCTFGVSTGSWAPFWIINGPVRNEININNSSGALSPGNIANSAIGRAMGLIIKNLGGIRKGIEDMGVMGNPMKYSMVIAENEEDSPWEPLHVEFGYRKEESTITVAYPQIYVQHWPHSTDDNGILRALLDNLLRGMVYTFVFTPLHAKILAKAGWTKQDIKDFIAEYARKPANNMGTDGGRVQGTLYKGKIFARENETVRIIRDTRVIRIMVAGGPGAFIAQIVGGGARAGNLQTKKIELPKNWDKLVAKYKDVVPVYVRY